MPAPHRDQLRLERMSTALDLAREHHEKPAGRAYRRAASPLPIGMALNDEESEQAGIDDAEARRGRVKSASREAAGPDHLGAQSRRAFDCRNGPPVREFRTSGESKG